MVTLRCSIVLSVLLTGLLKDEAIKPKNCGRYALTLIADFVGVSGAATGWDDILPPDGGPFSFAELEAAARRVGLETVLVEWADPGSAELHLPGILLVKATARSHEPDHFVTSFGSLGSEVCLGDYPHAAVMVSKEKLRDFWPGKVLYIGRAGDPELRRLRWRARLGSFRTVGLAVATSACLAWSWWVFHRSRRASSTVVRAVGEEP
jgi:hypothetical protein